MTLDERLVYIREPGWNSPLCMRSALHEERLVVLTERTIQAMDAITRLDERLEYIATLQQAHDEQIGNLVEQSALHEKRLVVLTERTIQATEAITRLARVADIH